MKTKQLQKIHKFSGLSAVVIIVMVAITGIFLNHTETLSLKKQPITNHWLNNWYGIELPKVKTALACEENWIIELNEQLYWNENKLDLSAILITSEQASIDEMPVCLVYTQSQLLLFTTDGELIDKLNYPDIVSLKRHQQNIWLSQADNLWRINSELSQFELVSFDKSTESLKLIQNSPKITPPPLTNTQDQRLQNLREQLDNQFNGSGLNLERLLLDLHSGRFFGQWGVWLVDLSAIVLIILSISGLILYFKMRKKQNKRNKKRTLKE